MQRRLPAVAGPAGEGVAEVDQQRPLRGHHRPARTLKLAATSLAGALGIAALAACGYDTTQQADISYAPAAAAQQLTDVCPDTLTVQLQWQPQSDMGAMFEMLGDDYTVDSATKSVSGTLISQGKDTGITLRLKAGGPAIGIQSVASQMYVDDDVTLGLVHGDQIIAARRSSASRRC